MIRLGGWVAKVKSAPPDSADARWARRLGYGARSLVDPAHAAAINRLLTPNDGELRRARAIVGAFESARAKGQARVEVEGSLIEVPTHSNAKRLVAQRRSLARVPLDDWVVCLMHGPTA